MNPLVSIIIPTIKDDPYVEDCLASIAMSSYDNIEIIVVNEGKERSAQRNIGISRATGDYLLFLDADQRVSPGLVQNCVDVFISKDDVSAIFIPEIITTEGFFGYLRNWERQFYTATPVDVPRIIRKECCVKFNENMSGPEDSDWAFRIKRSSFLGTSIHVLYHQDDIGFIEYFKKKAYYNISMAAFRSAHPHAKLLNPFWRCFGVFFEKGKWRRVIANPHLFICLMFVIFIRGIIYVSAK